MDVNVPALKRAWCCETAYHGGDPFVISKGQCCATALLVQDTLGGDIYGCKVGTTRHFFNVTDKGTQDYTTGQFPIGFVVKKTYLAKRTTLLKNPDVARRYQLLKERYDGNCQQG